CLFCLKISKIATPSMNPSWKQKKRVFQGSKCRLQF
ncbi:hypothetical protein DBR06_SOUSAS2810129, partial [Sousa chinensis]